jgi:hypothetical protein
MVVVLPNVKVDNKSVVENFPGDRLACTVGGKKEKKKFQRLIHARKPGTCNRDSLADQ